jgi:hypothetical protein
MLISENLDLSYAEEDEVPAFSQESHPWQRYYDDSSDKVSGGNKVTDGMICMSNGIRLANRDATASLRGGHASIARRVCFNETRSAVSQGHETTKRG